METNSIKCLDHGFVRLVDTMGDDNRIVQAARTSYGEGTKSVREDKGLIDYLIRHRHTSPLEQVQFTFHIKLPIFVMRQLVRHRTAKLNEYSGRYSVMKDEFYVPEISRLQAQSLTNKQGSDGDLPDDVREWFNFVYNHSNEVQYEIYEKALELGVSREIARINLPLSIYTEMYWTMDLHNLFHFIKLRADEHAQYEIRVFADALAQFVQQHCPFAYASFDNHIMNGRNLAGDELALLYGLVENYQKELGAEAEDKLGKSRAREFFAKFGL